MLDRIDEWTIDFHFDWRRGRRSKSGARHHRNGGCCRGFSSFFVHCNKSFVKDLRDVEVILRRPWRDLVEISATLWLIERGLHPERFKFFGSSDRCRLELELCQLKIHAAPFEFCA